MKIELTWGESVALRNAFVNQVSDWQLPVLNREYLNGLNYTPFEGNLKLVDITRQVVKRQIGKEYKYLFLTNGATGGIEIVLKAYRKLGKISCATFKAPYFRLYPKIISSAGLKHIDFENDDLFSPVLLVDLPSNPTGVFRRIDTMGLDIPVIWDTVYYTNSYARLLVSIKHDVVIGSYSKMTGLNGIRIGWIATDDDALALILQDLVAATYCGLSALSMDLLTAILPSIDWDLFESSSRNALDANRTEFSKLERYLSGSKIPDVGMFFYGQMDEACKKLFEKAEVVWTPGSNLGDTDDWGRFNIGRDFETTRKAVAQVLKADKT